MKEHAKMLVAFAGENPVAKAAGVPPVQVSRAIRSGRASPYAQMKLERMALEDLDQSATVNAKGTTLRLRALYAMGYATRVLADMLEAGVPQTEQVLAGNRMWVRGGYHRKVKSLFAAVQMDPEPEGYWADNARKRALSKGWLKPIELEEDLIDVPQPWAERMLLERAQELGWLGQQRSHKSLALGERSELAVVASKLFKIESRARRRVKEAI